MYRKHYYVWLDIHSFYAIIGDKTGVRALSISGVKKTNKPTSKENTNW